MPGTLRVGGGGRRGARAPRFSLLQLDDGEDYVLDVAGSMTAPPPAAPADEAGARTWWRGKARGRVRLLTKSLVFEPADASAPVVRFAFAGVTRLEAVGARRDAFELVSSKMTLVRGAGDARSAPRAAAADALAPWRFELPGEAFAKLFEPASGLLKVARQAPSVAEATLAAMRSRREDRARFDDDALADPSERNRVSFDAPAARMTPLVREPGRLVITDARVYFQPLAEISPVENPKAEDVKDAKARKRRLEVCDARGVVAVARRTHATRPLGVEFFFFSEAGEVPGEETDAPPSALFTLRTEAEREACVAAALAAAAASAAAEREPREKKKNRGSASVGSALAEAEPRALGAATDLWRAGDLSTLDYLIYLNVASGRSHSDLSQWPVMPWVLRDYTSERLDLDDVSRFRDLRRPVGALEPGRLRAFRERAAQMREATLTGVLPRAPPDAPNTPASHFLYGTHYSSPGYVLYWLLRSDPEHHLRLQSGAFDAPDRLFHGLAESFDGALLSTADVKELIPEFFCGSGDFLVNARNLRMGTRQVDGEELGDVRLPPWANGSPRVFILKHREALESEPVSRSIHAWIDLIFGYKQTGPNAEKADNTFHPLTYQGAARELDATKDPTQRRAKEAQIQEFGRAPRRLFARPHPRRDARAAREKWMTRGFEEEPKTSQKAFERGAAARARDVLATLAATLEASRPPSFHSGAAEPEPEPETETETESKGEGLDDVSDADARAAAAVADETPSLRARAEEHARRPVRDAAVPLGAPCPPPSLSVTESALADARRKKTKTRAPSRALENQLDDELEQKEEALDALDALDARLGASASPSWSRRAHDARVVGLGFSRDGNSVLGACGGARVTSRAARDGSLEYASVAPERRDFYAGGVACTSFALMSCAKDARAEADSASAESLCLPAALVGCGDGGVYAYGVEYGRVLGRLDAFSPEAVSALASPSERDDALFAASRGGAVRRWDVAAGRRVGALGDIRGVSGAFRSAAGLASGAAAAIGGSAVRAYTCPARGVRPAARGAGPATHDASLSICPYEANEEANERSDGVRVFEVALDCDARGELVLVSGIGGEVTAWDPRCARAAWTTEAFRRKSKKIGEFGADRRVRGIASSASRRRATAACADGFARALDLRMCGDVCDARFVGLGGLTCAAASGEDIVFVGGEDGRVAAVDWSGGPDAAAATYARNDGVSFFLPSVKHRGAARAGSGVSCLSVAPGGGALAAGWDDGTVAVFAET